MKMGTCADCGQPMHRGTTSLPQGVARCRECRKANPQPRARTTPKTPPPYKAMKCATCGCAIWKGSSSRPEGEAVCRACRRDSTSRYTRFSACPDCGTDCYGERCRPCADKARIIRAKDDGRLLRKHRESAAPGISWTARKNLLAKWKRQGKACTYCMRPADTIDHAVPLVRGGTNYEGNLVPCCRSCNGSKSGYLIAEWRTGKRLPRMTKAPEWKRSRKPIKPIKAIKGEQDVLRVCPCGSAYVGQGRYCSERCRARSAYRMKVGIPLDATPYGVRASA